MIPVFVLGCGRGGWILLYFILLHGQQGGSCSIYSRRFGHCIPYCPVPYPVFCTRGFQSSNRLLVELQSKQEIPSDQRSCLCGQNCAHLLIVTVTSLLAVEAVLARLCIGCATVSLQEHDLMAVKGSVGVEYYCRLKINKHTNKIADTSTTTPAKSDRQLQKTSTAGLNEWCNTNHYSDNGQYTVQQAARLSVHMVRTCIAR